MERYNSHLDLEQCAPLATITLSLSDPFSVIWNVLLLQLQPVRIFSLRCCYNIGKTRIAQYEFMQKLVQSITSILELCLLLLVET